MEYFGYFLAVNDGDIDTFVNDSHSTNIYRAAVQRTLISNIVTQGLKSVFFELKDRELCNALPYEVALCGIYTEQLSIMRKNWDDTKEYIKRI